MERILIVATSEDSANAIKALVLREGQFSISVASSGSQGRRLVLEEDWGVVVVNSPIRDDDAESFMRMLDEHSEASALLLAGSEDATLLEKRLEQTGTLILEKPLPRGLFHKAFHLALSLKAKLGGLKARNAKLESQLEDQKFIERAKISLIINNRMTEEEAHRHIEKTAMDSRVSRREVAKAILRIQTGKGKQD